MNGSNKGKEKGRVRRRGWGGRKRGKEKGKDGRET